MYYPTGASDTLRLEKSTLIFRSTELPFKLLIVNYCISISDSVSTIS